MTTRKLSFEFFYAVAHCAQKMLGFKAGDLRERRRVKGNAFGSGLRIAAHDFRVLFTNFRASGLTKPD